MKTIVQCSFALLLSALALALFACTSTPLGKSTSEQATAPALASTTQPGVVLPTVLADNVQPIYPKELLRERVTGSVDVDCVVDETGRVLMATVEKSTHPAFSKPALEAVRQWRFQPGTRNGVPASMHVTVPVTFAMER